MNAPKGKHQSSNGSQVDTSNNSHQRTVVSHFVKVLCNKNERCEENCKKDWEKGEKYSSNIYKVSVSRASVVKFLLYYNYTRYPVRYLFPILVNCLQ